MAMVNVNRIQKINAALNLRVYFGGPVFDTLQQQEQKIWQNTWGGQAIRPDA